MNQDSPFSWIRPDKFPVGGQVGVKSGSIYPEKFQSTEIYIRVSHIISWCLILNVNH